MNYEEMKKKMREDNARIQGGLQYRIQHILKAPEDRIRCRLQYEASLIMGGSLYRSRMSLLNHGDPFKVEKDDCVICLETMERYDICITLITCKHTFHRDCLKRWFSTGTKKLCPICRRPTA